MLICRLTLGSAPFNCGSLSMEVHVEIPGSCLPKVVPLLRYKGAKYRRNLINFFIKCKLLLYNRKVTMPCVAKHCCKIVKDRIYKSCYTHNFNTVMTPYVIRGVVVGQFEKLPYIDLSLLST